MSHRRFSSPPPVFRLRDLLRITTLLFMGVFVLWAIAKARNPHTWDWLFPEAEPAIAAEAPPEKGEKTEIKPAARRASIPDQTVVDGAWDRQRFLLDDPKDLGDQGNIRDANARYHLIDLAAKANAEDLSADALKNVRYTALMQSPQDYRGKVLHIEGDLRKITHFEMSRKLPGLEHMYQGWITAGGKDRVYCVLFADLPAGLPPEKDWSWFVAPVSFDGYFLKILKAEDSQRPGKPVVLPVLVGKTIQLPAAPPTNLISIAAIIAGVFVATLFVCGGAVWYYRRGDRRLAERMARRQRQEESPIFQDEPPAQETTEIV